MPQYAACRAAATISCDGAGGATQQTWTATVNHLDRKSLMRISQFFLCLSAVLLTLVVALAINHFVERRSTERLTASLLSELALQEELMAGSHSDHAVYPHVVTDLSFVMNPGLARATWKARAGEDYPINTIGLRGSEITSKPAGTKRIVLVGDSVLFGWRLSAEEMLDRQLRELLADRTFPGQYEVATVALPGWNTVDQDAFLRSHLARLDPDYVVWSLLRNDFADSPGAVPPGVLASWASPQKSREVPLSLVGGSMIIPAPSLLQRLGSNVRRIADFSSEFGIPVSVLWWREQDRVLVDAVLEDSEIGLRLLCVPHTLRFARDKWCIASDDCHPTYWANQQLAIALVDELMAVGMVDRQAERAEDAETVRLFREASRPSTRSDRDRYLARPIEPIGGSITPLRNSGALVGLVGSKMQRNGVFVFRKSGHVKSLRLELTVPYRRPGPPQSVSLIVRSTAGVIAEDLVVVRERMDYTIKLAESTNGFYEVSWEFAFSECEAPGQCYAAELVEAAIL